MPNSRGLLPPLTFGLALLGQTLLLYWPSAASGPDVGLPLDKVAHVLLFAVVAAAGVWARVPTPVLVALLLAQAAVSEVVQGVLLDQRGAEWGDLAADVLGIAVGLTLALWWRGRSHTQSRSPLTGKSRT